MEPAVEVAPAPAPADPPVPIEDPAVAVQEGAAEGVTAEDGEPVAEGDEAEAAAEG